MCTETNLGLLGIEELKEFLQFMVFIDPSVPEEYIQNLLVRKTDPDPRLGRLPWIAVCNSFEVKFLEKLVRKCEKFLESIGFEHKDFNQYI